MTKRVSAKIVHIETDFSIAELENESWSLADIVRITKNWSGAAARFERHAKVNMLWSATALYIRFIANQYEPLNINDKPDLTTKTLGLWEKDVCELFITPDPKDLQRYFEFEIAPNGEWVDLDIRQSSKERKTFWEYNSGMEAFAKIKKQSVLMAIKIPWNAFGKVPKANDSWLGNLFRLVGRDKTRGYLAWSPTETTKPNFHVPEKFGRLVFMK